MVIITSSQKDKAEKAFYKRRIFGIFKKSPDENISLGAGYTNSKAPRGQQNELLDELGFDGCEQLRKFGVERLDDLTKHDGVKGSAQRNWMHKMAMTLHNNKENHCEYQTINTCAQSKDDIFMPDLAQDINGNIFDEVANRQRAIKAKTTILEKTFIKDEEIVMQLIANSVTQCDYVPYNIDKISEYDFYFNQIKSPLTEQQWKYKPQEYIDKVEKIIQQILK